MRACWLRGQALRTALLCALIASPLGVAHAETIQQTYEAGVKAYYAGHFAETVERLERLASLPIRHEDLYYNLGCAYFRLGQLGPAAFNFARAVQRSPSAEDARHNLRLVRERAAAAAKGAIAGGEAGGGWLAWADRVSFDAFWASFLALWWALCAALFLLRRLRPGPTRAALLLTTLLLGLASAAEGTLLAVRVQRALSVRQGIVLPATLALREGPDPKARASVKIAAGAAVRLTETSGAWLRIRLPNGLEGWVDQTSIGVLDRAALPTGR